MEVLVTILAGIGIVTLIAVAAVIVLLVLCIVFGTGEVTINGRKYVRKDDLGWWRREE